MGIIARTLNRIIDSFWEAPQVAKPEHLQVKGGWYIFRLVKDLLRKGVYRAEIRFKGLKTFFRHTVGFTFEIGTDHKTKGGAVIYQVWEGGSPSNSIQWDYETNEIFYRVSGPKPTYNKVLFKAEVGKPNRIVFEIDGKYDGSGRTRIYVDGRLAEDFRGRNMYGDPQSKGYIKFGMYDDDVDEWPANLPERVAKFKDIVIADYGTDLNEVGLTVSGNSGPIVTPGPEEPNPVPEAEDVEGVKRENTNLRQEISKLNRKIEDFIKSVDNILKTN